MKKILIVKTSSLGDIIHTFPAIAYLKNKIPDARIDWVVERPFQDLVKAHPLIHQTLTVDTKKWRHAWFHHRQEIGAFRKELRSETYDLLFDFQGNVKSGLITSQALSKFKVGFNRRCVAEWPNCLFTRQRFYVGSEGNIRDDYLNLVKAFFNEKESLTNNDQGMRLRLSEDQSEIVQKTISMHSSVKKVMVCPGSQWQNKQITLEALKDFLQLLQPYLHCHFYLVWGNEAEKKSVQQVAEAVKDCTILEKMPLPTLQNLMCYMDLVVAMDSLPLHLAGIGQTPTFSIFGPSSASKYKPEGTQHVAFQGRCPYKRTFEKRCPILRSCPTGACIRGLTGEEIFDFFQKYDFIVNS